MDPSCYVIVLNYNGSRLGLLGECFDSLMDTTYPAVRFLLVDNGSQDDSVGFIQKRYPRVEILENQVNLGFAEGNNRGIRTALSRQADYVVLLNNDTRVEADWLTRLVEVAEQDAEIGLCESQQYTWDGQRLIQYSLRLDWLEGEKNILPLDRAARKPHPTMYASGCCMLMRRALIERIGMFDPRYFAYDEDVDLSLRAWIAGYQVYLAPGSIVYHKGGVTLPSLDQMRLGYRNQLFTMFKNYEMVTISKFYRSIVSRWLLTRNRYALQGALALVGSMGPTIRLRKQVQASRKRSDEEIFTLAGAKQ